MGGGNCDRGTSYPQMVIEGGPDCESEAGQGGTLNWLLAISHKDITHPPLHPQAHLDLDSGDSLYLSLDK